jgi:hypothetical protein
MLLTHRAPMIKRDLHNRGRLLTMIVIRWISTYRDGIHMRSIPQKV